MAQWQSIKMTLPSEKKKNDGEIYYKVLLYLFCFFMFGLLMERGIKVRRGIFRVDAERIKDATKMKNKNKLGV